MPENGCEMLMSFAMIKLNAMIIALNELAMRRNLKNVNYWTLNYMYM